MKPKPIKIKNFIPDGATTLSPFELEHARFLKPTPTSNPIAASKKGDKNRIHKPKSP